MDYLFTVPEAAGRTDPADLAVGVVGAGTMGAGIALVAAQAGHPVRLLDVRARAADDAIRSLRARLDRLAGKGKVSPDEARTTGARLAVAADVAGLAGCAVVVEAVAEDLAVKRALLAELEDVLSPTALLGTNTSSLSVTAVAAGLRHPERVVGLHFFNPADRMQLVEVVRGEATCADTVATATALARAWGKTPVACSSTPGFVVNRVARPYYGEAQRLVEAGVADPATVDAVLRECGGFALGPFELTDLVGQDVNLAVSRSVWAQTFNDPRYAPSVLQQRLVDAGRLGRKSGRGVYAYAADGSGPPLDPDTGAAPEPATVSERHLAPREVHYCGGWNVLLPLLARLGSTRVSDVSEDAGAPSDGCSHAPGLVLPSGGLLVETPAEARLSPADDAVALDWVLDATNARRFCLAPLAGASRQTVAEAVGLLQSTGAAVTVVRPAAGLVVARTVAMLVNEAVDLVARGEADAVDVDTAMRLGTRYPLGPLEWGDRLGPLCVRAVLEALAAAEPTGRYRASPALVVAAETGGLLRV